jgi:hypothetical protein
VAARFRARWLAAWRDITKWRWYHAAAWVEIVRGREWVRLANGTFAWKDFYIKGGTTPPASPPPAPPPPPPPPSVTLSVTATPSSISGTRTGAGVVYTNVTDVNVTKGTGPYTYTFSRVSYSGSVAPTIIILGGDPSKMQSSRNMAGTVPETQTARFKCLVRDSKGNRGSVYIDAAYYTTAQTNTGGQGTVNHNYYDPVDGLTGGEVP